MSGLKENLRLTSN